MFFLFFWCFFFFFTQKTAYEMRISDWSSYVCSSDLASALFIEMLTSEKDPETTLRRLNEAGVLGRFLPDFGRVVAQMQYNMYHHYTVDEHTIFAIGILHAIE